MGYVVVITNFRKQVRIVHESQKENQRQRLEKKILHETQDEKMARRKKLLNRSYETKKIKNFTSCEKFLIDDDAYDDDKGNTTALIFTEKQLNYEELLGKHALDKFNEKQTQAKANPKKFPKERSSSKQINIPKKTQIRRFKPNFLLLQKID